MLSKISESLSNLSGAERKVAESALAEPKWFVHAANPFLPQPGLQRLA